MNIALIGESITSLLLSKILTKKNINVSLFFERNNFKKKSLRTLGISKNNIDFLKKNNLDLSELSWPIKGIKIFNETNRQNELLNFKNNKNNLFSLVKNEDLFNLLRKKLNKNKLLKKFEISNNYDYQKILKNYKYDLIINSDTKNNISKNFSHRKINKDYNSFAFTTFINHNSCKNNFATQIFTKNGPLAFLPYSKNQTSVVFSLINNNFFLNSDIEKLVREYNNYYKINSFSKFEKFKLSFSFARNYYYNNILFFGDNIHKVHPLAGQGFNMIIRDIIILENIIDQKLTLGLPLDKSIFKDFESKTKHLNFLFSSGIDIIHEFFKFENKIGNKYSEELIKYLGKNKLFNKYMPNIADKGLLF